MKISKYHSSKLSVLSFLLIVMVVYIHSTYLELMGTPYEWIQSVVGGICRVANPLFFLISGFLFFNGIQHAKECLSKMKKRVKTLFIPYIIWNIIFVLWYVLLAFLPEVKGFVNSDILGHFQDNPLKIAEFLFWSPANFPLWFLRDLMCLVVFSPLIYYLLKYTRYWIILLLILLSPWISSIFTGLQVFFFIGGYIAMYHTLEEVDSFVTKLVFFIGTLLYAGIIYLAATENKEVIKFSEIILNLGGIIVVWKMYDIIYKGKNLAQHKLWSVVCRYSFFIYLFHEPVFNIIKKLTLKLAGASAPSLIVLYLINPLIMCAISLMVAKFIQKCSPKLYGIAVGGR